MRAARDLFSFCCNICKSLELIYDKLFVTQPEREVDEACRPIHIIIKYFVCDVPDIATCFVSEENG